ncbi:MAG: hypothetical protein K0U36_01075, partial [Alphaproteobacteria bacterium]|nr:hypothetical protein [Alphaproteobacteria bacterium]
MKSTTQALRINKVTTHNRRDKLKARGRQGEFGFLALMALAACDSGGSTIPATGSNTTSLSDVTHTDGALQIGVDGILSQLNVEDLEIGDFELVGENGEVISLDKDTFGDGAALAEDSEGNATIVISNTALFRNSSSFSSDFGNGFRVSLKEGDYNSADPEGAPVAVTRQALTSDLASFDKKGVYVQNAPEDLVIEENLDPSIDVSSYFIAEGNAVLTYSVRVSQNGVLITGNDALQLTAAEGQANPSLIEFIDEFDIGAYTVEVTATTDGEPPVSQTVRFAVTVVAEPPQSTAIVIEIPTESDGDVTWQSDNSTHVIAAKENGAFIEVPLPFKGGVGGLTYSVAGDEAMADKYFFLGDTLFVSTEIDHEFTVIAMDVTGASKSITFQVDRADVKGPGGAPTTVGGIVAAEEIVYAGSEGINDVTVEVADFFAGGDGDLRYTYRDGASNVAVDQSGRLIIPHSALSDGDNSYIFDATDNDGETASFTLTLDKKAHSERPAAATQQLGNVQTYADGTAVEEKIAIGFGEIFAIPNGPSGSERQVELVGFSRAGGVKDAELSKVTLDSVGETVQVGRDIATGIYTITLEVTDADGYIDQIQHTFTIEDDEAPTQASGATAELAKLNSETTYTAQDALSPVTQVIDLRTIFDTNSGNGTLEFDVTAPEGVVASIAGNTLSVTWTPTQAGEKATFALVVEATDDDGDKLPANLSLSFEEDETPTQTSGATTELTKLNSEKTYTAQDALSSVTKAIDLGTIFDTTSGNGPLEFDVTAPEGVVASIAGNTLSVTWTPTQAGEQATFALVVEAADANGDKVSASLSLSFEEDEAPAQTTGAATELAKLNSETIYTSSDSSIFFMSVTKTIDLETLFDTNSGNGTLEFGVTAPDGTPLVGVVTSIVGNTLSVRWTPTQQNEQATFALVVEATDANGDKVSASLSLSFKEDAQLLAGTTTLSSANDLITRAQDKVDSSADDGDHLVYSLADLFIGGDDVITYTVTEEVNGTVTTLDPTATEAKYAINNASI